MRALWKVSVAYSWTIYVADDTETAVTGLVNGDFTKQLAADDTNSGQTVTVTEIDSSNLPGWYKVVYTPNALGHWACRVAHSTHNKVGWMDEIQVYTRSLEDLAFPTTTGRSMDVDASGGVEVGSFQAGAITSSAFAADAITATVIAADAIGSSELAAAAATEIADAILGRGLSNVEGSAGQQTLAGAIAKLTNKVVIDEGDEELTVYKTDGTTVYYAQDIVTDATASPIIEID